MKKNKLKIDQLSVESITTDLEKKDRETIKGGETRTGYNTCVFTASVPWNACRSNR